MSHIITLKSKWPDHDATFPSFPQTEKWCLFNSLDSEWGNLLLKKERETLVDICLKKNIYIHWFRVHVLQLFLLVVVRELYWLAYFSLPEQCDSWYSSVLCMYAGVLNMVSLWFQDRPSTKVHAAPGGGSSLDYLFGGGGSGGGSGGSK